MKSVTAAEILAAGEAIDKSKIISYAYSKLLDMQIGVRICVDPKDLFSSLSTQKNVLTDLFAQILQVYNMNSKLVI